LQYYILECLELDLLWYSFNAKVQQTNAPKGVLSRFLNLMCWCLIGFLGKGICPLQNIFLYQKKKIHPQARTVLRTQPSKVSVVVVNTSLSPLKTNLYIRNQSVPRCKHFPPWL
jgi:hypothetical protein